MPFCFECYTGKLFNRYTPPVTACHLWCFNKQHQLFTLTAPGEGEPPPGTTALTISEHTYDTYTFQHEVSRIPAKSVSAAQLSNVLYPGDSNVIDTVYWLLNRPLNTVLSLTFSLTCGAFTVSYLSHALIIFLLNGDLFLRSSKSLTYFFFFICIIEILSRNRRRCFKSDTRTVLSYSEKHTW